jgi:hypothetical protein
MHHPLRSAVLPLDGWRIDWTRTRLPLALVVFAQHSTENAVGIPPDEGFKAAFQGILTVPAPAKRVAVSLLPTKAPLTGCVRAEEMPLAAARSVPELVAVSLGTATASFSRQYPIGLRDMTVLE